ncbi:MAG: hypothetical protein ACRC14_12070, partial [Paracoccaceae bacterium]
QSEQAKMQLDEQKAEADMAMRQQENQQKMELEAAKLELEREKLALERERMAIDREKMTAEGGRADREFAVKSGEMMAPALSPQMDGMLAILTQMQQDHAETTQMMTQGLAQIAQIVAAGDQQIVAAMTQPKELVRDVDGRIAGVRPVQQRVN